MQKLQDRGADCRQEVDEMKNIPLNDAVRLISPRIIALITTIDSNGNVNGAPYSFVAPVSFNPPLVYVGIGGKYKHTYINAKATGEFVINIVSEDFGQQAVNCEARHKPGEDLLKKNGLGISPSQKVKPPRVKESGAVLECKVKDMIEIPGSDHILMIGEIVTAESAGGLDEIKPLLHEGGSRFRSVGKGITLKRSR